MKAGDGQLIVDAEAAAERALQRSTLAAAVLMERIVRDIYTKRGPTEISATQWAAMRFFNRVAEENRTSNHLARFLGMTAGPTSRALASMERRGLVTRRPNPRDGRSFIVELTKKGLDALHNDPILALAKAIEGMKPEKCEALEEALDTIAFALARRTEPG